MPFACSICEQESTRICAYCTKDACGMHICEHCGCCSDCCDCDVPLDETTQLHVAAAPEPALESVPEPDPESTPEMAAVSEDQPLVPEEPSSDPFETHEV
jgi:hypothetical protein